MKHAAHNEREGVRHQGPPTVLVYLTGALGDVILSTPTLGFVRTVHTGMHVHGIVPGALAELYPDLFDSVTSVDSAAVAELFGVHARQALKGHPVWRNVRKAVLFEPPTSVLAKALRSAGGIEVVCIDAAPSHCHGEHYAKWLWRNTAEMLEAAPEFAVPMPHVRQPEVVPEGIFGVVHPGSGSTLKNCPTPRLVAACREFGRVELIVLEGESDGDAVEAFVRTCGMPARVMNHMPLPELAWHLKHADFYIGNDSGISHLAGAVGAQGIAFFGRSDAQVWQPLGSGIEIRRFI